jgi:CheY-like chemotaxis protein
MKPKLLIVDDEQCYRERFSELLKDFYLDIILAEGVEEGIEKALAERPEAIITDKDMPDGTGNDLARAVKQEYDVRIAGITNGEASEFDEELFDIRESKQVNNDSYKELVTCLLYAKDPGKKYAESGLGSQSGNTQEMENVAAVSLLLQGYTIARKLQRGEQIEGVSVKLPVPSEEKTLNMLAMEDIGLDPAEFYETLCRIDAGLEQDAVTQELFEKIADKKFDEVTYDAAKHVEEVLYKILEG